VPVFGLTRLDLLALRVVKEMGKGKAPKRPGFRVSAKALLAAQSFAKANMLTFGDTNDPKVFAELKARFRAYLLTNSVHTEAELGEVVPTNLHNEVLAQHVDHVPRSLNGECLYRSVSHGFWEVNYENVLLMLVGVASKPLVSASGISDPNGVQAQHERTLILNAAVLVCLAMQASEKVKSFIDAGEGVEMAVEDVIK